MYEIGEAMKFLFFVYTFTFSLLLLGALPLTGEAHGVGLSIEQEVGEYLLDVGYGETPRARESSRFDIDISKKDGSEVPFTDVWVRIETGPRFLFAGSIHRSSLGSTGFTYSFPEAGTYTIRLRFHNDQTAITEATFPFRVEEGVREEESRTAFSSFSFFLGMTVGAAIALLFAWKGSRLAHHAVKGNT